MQNLILYDWVSITSKIHSEWDIVKLLGMTSCPWEMVCGAKGYRDRLYFNCISVHYNSPEEEKGIWLEMTGQGCRAFETYGTGDYEALFELVGYYEGQMNLTRLDVCLDDHGGILDMAKLLEDTRNGAFISKSRVWEIREGTEGATVYHGSKQSDTLVRIYDKAAERHVEDGSHWIRVELQLRRERALRFVQTAGEIGEKFSGVLVNYLRYIEPSDFDSNRWRWPLKGYWAVLVGSALAIRLYSRPGTDYNVDHLERYVIRQAGNAIDAYIKIFGTEALLDDLSHRGTMENPKYRRLIQEYGRESIWKAQ